jgi:hypothetical protein
VELVVTSALDDMPQLAFWWKTCGLRARGEGRRPYRMDRVTQSAKFNHSVPSGDEPEDETFSPLASEFQTSLNQR